MSDLPSRRDLFDVGRRAIITTPNIRINPAVIDIPGSDVNVAVGAMSMIGEEIVARLAVCIRGLFVETARGAQLDRVAFDRYGLTRFPATPSQVTCKITRLATGAGGVWPAGSRVQTPQGTQFATDVDLVFSGITLTGSVACTALVAGPDSNVSLNTITQFLDPPTFDTTFTVTNTEGAAGGALAEADIPFRGRIRDFFPTVRRGTLGAIEYGARQVAGIAIAKATEVLNSDNTLPAGIVQLIVGDNNGIASAPLLQQVKDIEVDYRAAGIPVQIFSGIVSYVSVIWKLSFTSGVDTISVAEQVRAVTVAVCQFKSPGQTLFTSDLIAAAKTVPGAVVNDNSLIAPLGSVIPVDVSTVLRILPQGVTFV